MPVHLTCPACDASYSRPPSHAARARYCSLRCARANRPAAVPTEPLLISEDGTTALVPLRARDGSIKTYALIDAADAEWVNQWLWHLNGNGYVARNVADGPNKQTKIYLQRALLGLPHKKGSLDLTGDHIDRDPLNNRRGNLRAIPEDGNKQNVSSVSGSASKYRGVSWDTKRRKWRAAVRVNDKSHVAGYFSDEDDAGQAARTIRLAHLPYAID